MYRLFKRTTNGLDKLKALIRAHIKHTGGLLNEQVEGHNAKARPGSAESIPEASAQIIPEASAASTSGTLSPTAWVFSVSQLKDKYDTILAKAYEGNSTLEATMNEVGYRGLRYSITSEGISNIHQYEPSISGIPIHLHG